MSVYAKLNEMITKKCLTKNHTDCQKVCDMINKNIDAISDQVTQNFVDMTLKYLMYKKSYYSTPDVTMCIKNMDICSDALTHLIKLHRPSNDIIKSLVFNNDQIIKILIDCKYELGDDILEYAMADYKEIANDLSKYEKQKVTQENLHSSITYNNLNVFLNLIARKVKPKTDAIFQAITNGNEEIVEEMIKITEITHDEKLLSCACISNNVNLIKMFLDLKIIPTKKCYQDLFTNYDNMICEKDKKAKIQSINICINILVNNGYVLDYNDVVFATQRGIKIDNIEKYNIEFKDDYMQICAQHNFYPYESQNKLDTICLLQACSVSGNMANIKKILNHGVMPTTECLREACKIKSNLNAIKLLITKGAKVDIICIKNMADALANRTICYVVDGYIEAQNNAKKEIPIENKKEIYKLEKHEINPKNKYQLDGKLSKLLSNRSKSTMYSTIKKKFTTFILKNKLSDNELVKINTTLNQISGITVDHYFELNELDNFIIHCINYCEQNKDANNIDDDKNGEVEIENEIEDDE